MNKETENVLETLAVLFERFERANSDLADIDKQFDVRYEEMEELVEGEGLWRLRSWWRSSVSAASGIRCTYRRMAADNSDGHCDQLSVKRELGIVPKNEQVDLQKIMGLVDKHIR